LSELRILRTNATKRLKHVSCSVHFVHWLWHYTTGGKVAGSILDKVIGILNWPNPSSRTMDLGSTQPLTEMSTRNLPGGRRRPARKTDNLTAISEPIVWKMWEPRRLTTLQRRVARTSSLYALSISPTVYREEGRKIRFSAHELVSVLIVTPCSLVDEYCRF
jgi:hypothetical protein